MDRGLRYKDFHSKRDRGKNTFRGKLSFRNSDNSVSCSSSHYRPHIANNNLLYSQMNGVVEENLKVERMTDNEATERDCTNAVVSTEEDNEDLVKNSYSKKDTASRERNKDSVFRVEGHSKRERSDLMNNTKETRGGVGGETRGGGGGETRGGGGGETRGGGGIGGGGGGGRAVDFLGAIEDDEMVRKRIVRNNESRYERGVYGINALEKANSETVLGEKKKSSSVYTLNENATSSSCYPKIRKMDESKSDYARKSAIIGFSYDRGESYERESETNHKEKVRILGADGKARNNVVSSNLYYHSSASETINEKLNNTRNSFLAETQENERNAHCLSPAMQSHENPQDIKSRSAGYDDKEEKEQLLTNCGKPQQGDVAAEEGESGRRKSSCVNDDEVNHNSNFDAAVEKNFYFQSLDYKDDEYRFVNSSSSAAASPFSASSVAYNESSFKFDSSLEHNFNFFPRDKNNITVSNKIDGYNMYAKNIASKAPPPPPPFEVLSNTNNTANNNFPVYMHENIMNNNNNSTISSFHNNSNCNNDLFFMDQLSNNKMRKYGSNFNLPNSSNISYSSSYYTQSLGVYNNNLFNSNLNNANNVHSFSSFSLNQMNSALSSNVRLTSAENNSAIQFNEQMINAPFSSASANHNAKFINLLGNYGNPNASFSSCSPTAFERTYTNDFTFHNAINPSSYLPLHYNSNAQVFVETLDNFKGRKSDLCFSNNFIDSARNDTTSKDKTHSTKGNTILVKQMPLQFCNIDSINGFFKNFGPIKKIRCEIHQHRAFVTFEETHSAELASKTKPFGLNTLEVLHLSNFPVAKNTPNFISSSSFCQTSSSASSSISAKQKLVSPSSLSKYKFESEEYMQRKNRLLELKNQRIIAQAKLQDYHKRMTDLLRNLLAELTSKDTTEERKIEVRNLVTKVKEKMTTLIKKSNPKKSEEEIRLEARLKKLQMDAEYEGVDSRSILRITATTNPFKLDNRTTWIEVTPLPPEVIDEDSFAFWIMKNTDVLLSDVIELLYLGYDKNRNKYGAIKYFTRQSAEQVIRNSAKSPFKLKIVENPNMQHEATISQNTCDDSSAVEDVTGENTTNHVTNAVHTLHAHLNAPNEFSDRVAQNEEMIHSGLHHQDTEVDYGDEVE